MVCVTRQAELARQPASASRSKTNLPLRRAGVSTRAKIQDK
jgi:hypothetical protein